MVCAMKRLILNLLRRIERRLEDKPDISAPPVRSRISDPYEFLQHQLETELHKRAIPHRHA